MIKILFFISLGLGSATLFANNTMTMIANWPLDPLIKRALTSADEDIALKTRPIVISLGQDCQPALNLMYAKLRFMAYPFDWIVAPFDEMYDAIDTDFFYFRKREYFVNSNDPRLNNYHITNIHYPQLLFPHAKWETLFEDFNRRIGRFYKAIHHGEMFKKRIYFVIHSSTFKDGSVKDKADRLCALFSRKFPGLDFELIVMHHADELGSFASTNCKFCYLEHAGWTQESYNEWSKKLAAMGLANPQADSFSEDHPFKGF